MTKEEVQARVAGRPMFEDSDIILGLLDSGELTESQLMDYFGLRREDLIVSVKD